LAATKSRSADGHPVLHFFAGKGGVGKTTLAAAAARAAAARGRRVLAISTDPAHSLGDALGRRLSAAARRIPSPPSRSSGRGRLEAAELDAAAALAQWTAPRRRALEKVLLRGTLFDRQDVARLLELPLPGLDELVALAAIDELARERGAELVIVDTAPTGHTWRLLDAPETIAGLAGVMDTMLARDRVIAEAVGGRAPRDVADAVVEELAGEAGRLAARLRDPRTTRISWVTLAEPVAIAEAVDGVTWLRAHGLPLTEIIVNRSTAGLEGGREPACRTCRARAAMERSALAPLRRAARGVPFRYVAEFRPAHSARPPAASSISYPHIHKPQFPLHNEQLRLLIVGGKGGVGKTTVAAAMAIDAVRRDPARRVLLLSTDPAHSLGDVLGLPLGDAARAVPGVAGVLEAREIDAAAALEREREGLRRAVHEMFGGAGRSGVRVDLTHDRAVAASLLDLSPPGLDEIVALLSVIDALQTRGDASQSRGTTLPGRHSGPYDLVVIDTAPTGHALKLLAMPELAERWVAELMRLLLKYREVARIGPLAAPLLTLSRGAKRLQALLRDRREAQVVAVTRAAALPRLETIRLMDALRALKIAVPAVVVNAVTPQLRGRGRRAARCARCRAARAAERAEITALAGRCGRPPRCDIILAPLVLPPPRGTARLAGWMRQWHRLNAPRTSTRS
jgi:arsenite-transporting ATPase